MRRKSSMLTTRGEFTDIDARLIFRQDILLRSNTELGRDLSARRLSVQPNQSGPNSFPWLTTLLTAGSGCAWFPARDWGFLWREEPYLLIGSCCSCWFPF